MSLAGDLNAQPAATDRQPTVDEYTLIVNAAAGALEGSIGPGQAEYAAIAKCAAD